MASVIALASGAHFQSEQLDLAREAKDVQMETRDLAQQAFKLQQDTARVQNDLQQQAVDFAKKASDFAAARRREDNFQRRVDNARRIVDITSERLAYLSNLAALFAGFSIVAFVELDVPDTTHESLLIMFSIVTTTTISLLVLSMVTSLMMMLYMRSYPVVRSQLPARTGGPSRVRWKRTFIDFQEWWETRMRKWWAVSVFSFLIGVLFFMVTLAIVAWIKFHNWSAVDATFVSFLAPVFQTSLVIVGIAMLIIVYFKIGACRLVNLGVVGVEDDGQGRCWRPSTNEDSAEIIEPRDDDEAMPNAWLPLICYSDREREDKNARREEAEDRADKSPGGGVASRRASSDAGATKRD
jgi:hypothetical protein